MAMNDTLMSTAEVAAKLGVTRQRVHELITEARLPARKVGRAYVIRAGDVASLEIGSVGRPPNAPGAKKRATSQKRANGGASKSRKK